MLKRSAIIRSLGAFAVASLSTASLLLFLAVSAVWAVSYRTAVKCNLNSVGSRPGEPWVEWRAYVSCGGVEVTRSCALSEHPTQAEIDRELVPWLPPHFLWDADEPHGYPEAYDRPAEGWKATRADTTLGFHSDGPFDDAFGRRPSHKASSLIFPLWFPAIVFAVLPAGRMLACARRRRRAGETRGGRCARCGYDLRGTPDRCPECGAVPASPRSLPRTNDTRDEDADGPRSRERFAAWAGVLSVPVLVAVAALWAAAFWRDQHATYAGHQRRAVASERLAAGARTGDAQTILWALDEGADVNALCESAEAPDEPSYPLELAVRHGDPDIVGLLLRRGADVTLTTTPGLLFQVQGERAAEVAQEVISAGADVNARTADGDTPLHVAAGAGDGTGLPLVEVLVAAGANVNARDDVLGDTPLSRAIRAGDDRVAEFLTDHGAEQ